MRVDPSFDTFVEQKSAALLRLAYLLTGDRGHAEDLLQTALLRTMRRWSKACHAPESYVRHVMINLSRDRIRALLRRPRETALPEDTNAFRSDDPGLAGIGDRRMVTDAIRKLPVRQRQVIVLRYFEDLSVEQTAELLDCSSGTVKSYTSRALSRLRELLGDFHETNGRRAFQ
ncbi:RNA polymerase sigma-70 factor (sigma-E family) [Micromonospora vinacea]|uniref:RNA polymerase sigma-70 factor (Sigma-E family) n=1 Tax=Micromonospora vinacea TaxID=709878 RepID=A0ABS0KBI2_9ACTN|nr:SigE family RNA polymerase sigma factor [Micromonospora vinacea]MBG6105994.1 RNA polymerase sigma-70 factor (sigma-E family) [Micromonospora vinacea]WTA65707.1 SigE family RNA polymerase sigma factor [Micromonospora sp. NBC_00855]